MEKGCTEIDSYFYTEIIVICIIVENISLRF